MTTTEKKTYRIFFTKTLSNEMSEFAKEYNDKPSKEFRQEWNQWTNRPNIQALIDETIAKNPMTAKNTLYDKIYESMRYHHRKKISKSTPSVHDSLPAKPLRKKTTVFSQNFIRLIHEHVQQCYFEKPERAYDLFVQSHLSEIIQEKTYLRSKYEEIYLYDLDHEQPDVHFNKFKCNYKNKFQQIKRTI